MYNSILKQWAKNLSMGCSTANSHLFIYLFYLQSDILIFQVFLRQLMILRQSGLLSKASKTMQMAVNLQVLSGELLRV